MFLVTVNFIQQNIKFNVLFNFSIVQYSEMFNFKIILNYKNQTKYTAFII